MRQLRRVILSATCALAASTVAVSPAWAAPSPSPSAIASTAVVGSAPVVPQTAHALGALPSSQQLTFDVVLKSRNQAGLDSFVQAVSTPGSPQYRHFLTSAQFQNTFGPTPQAVASVTAQLRSLGLHIDQTLGSVMTVSGSTAAVGSALHTSFEQYRLTSGRVVHANMSAPQLPVTVAPLVQSVIGLNNLVLPQHAPVVPRPAPGSLNPNYTGGECFGQDTGASAPYHYYTPQQLASRYGLSPYYSSNDLGSGVTVALFELEPFSSSDISTYKSCFGASNTVTTVRVNGGAGSGPGPNGEAALDIEDVVSLAPKAAIKVYEGPIWTTATDADIVDVYNKIATDNIAQVVSTSWGECEPATSAYLYHAERAVFQKMAALGQTVLAASGDSGSAACDRADTSPQNDSELATDDPASQPEVTGVGGTRLSTASGPESVWNDGTSVDTKYGGYDVSAGGGGISALWPMPAWQTNGGVISDSSGSPCGAPGGSYCREVPDVSASADPYYGYLIYWNSSTYFIGGTSAAAPTWASLIALIDSTCSGHRLGFINPALYQLSSADFYDVTTGNNDGDGANGGLYAAHSGYDLATGLGTPRGAALGADLCPGVAANGAGTMTADTTWVPTSSHDTLTFTYTAPAGQALTNGTITVVVPAGWSVPSTASAAAGYTTASEGMVSTSGQTITVAGITTLAGGNVTVVYGDTSGGGSGAVAPSSAQASTFTTKMRSTASGTLSAVSSPPVVQVLAAATIGSGTVTVSPASVGVSSAQPIVLTYSPAPGTYLTNAEVTIDVPAGWSVPSTTSSAAGYTIAKIGSTSQTVNISGSTIQVTGVTMLAGSSLTITYGDTSGGGGNAHAPASAGLSIFDAQMKTNGGMLAALSTSPTVQVVGPADDGSGTASVTPSSVTEGGTATLTFTYQPPATGYLNNGAFELVVPNDWTAPQTSDNSAAGYVTATSTDATQPTTTVSGANIDLTGLNLEPGEKVTITYAGATVPATVETSTFGVLSRAGSGGTLKALTPSTVAVSVAAPPSGGGGGGGGGGGHPALQRVFGSDRIATSIAASQAAFPKAYSARVVVLARADNFADALSGTPLAAEEGGPLLLTPSANLDGRVLTEIERVLPGGATIYILGGTSAVSVAVETALSNNGYTIERLSGNDRYGTAVAVAGALHDPNVVFEADGTNFPDALSAGAAAAREGGAILLTAGSTMAATTATYLAAHPGDQRFAIGGPAARADQQANAYIGTDRYGTSVLVARAFFDTPTVVGLASGANFPDALSGGTVAALGIGPMLLVPPSGALPAGTAAYLQTASLSASSAWLFGGSASVNDTVFGEIATILAG